MDEIRQIEEIIATLNLESETTAEIVQTILPLLYWKFAWLPLLGVIAGVVLGLGVLAFFALIVRTEHKKFLKQQEGWER